METDFSEQRTKFCERLQGDPELAWVHHCNVAMAIHDEIDGISHQIYNRAAARVMKALFGVDVTGSDYWKQFENEWRERCMFGKEDWTPGGRTGD